MSVVVSGSLLFVAFVDVCCSSGVVRRVSRVAVCLLDVFFLFCCWLCAVCGCLLFVVCCRLLIVVSSCLLFVVYCLFAVCCCCLSFVLLVVCCLLWVV